MDYIKLLEDFSWAVINNWAGKATGGVIVALVWLWSTLKQTPVSKKFGIGLALVFLFFAFFNAWRDQNRLAEISRAELAAKFKPQFEVRQIDQWAVGPFPMNDKSSLVTVEFAIRNLGMPSIAEGWELEVTLPEGDIHIGDRVVFPGNTTLAGSTGNVPLFQEDNLHNKAVKEPIPTGGLIRGWLMFRIDDVPEPRVFRKGTKMKVSFDDVTGKNYSVEQILSGTSELPKYYPGTKANGVQ